MAKEKTTVSNTETPEPNVDRGYAWVILAGCFIMYMFSVGTIKAYGVLYTEMVSYFGTGSGNTAWIGSILLLFMLGLSPVSNMLSRYFSFRRVAFVGGILLGGGYFLSGFCSRMEYMYLTMSLCAGLGYGLSFAPSSTIISYYFDKNRALANGISVSASGIGALAFPSLYRYLINQYGLPGTFWIVGAILSNVCVAACLFRQPRLLVEDKKRAKTSVQRSGSHDQKALLNGTDSKVSPTEPGCCERSGINLKFSLLKNLKFSLYCISFIFCMNGYGGNLILIPSQIKALGYDKFHVVYGVTIMGGCEMAARIFFGWLGDRKVIKQKYIYLTSVFISAVFSFISPSFRSFTYMAIYSAIVGTFPGSIWSLIPILLIDIVGLRNFAPAFGLAMMGIAVGVVISQPVVGWLEDYTGSWNASFYLTGCLLFISGIIVCFEPFIVRMCTRKDSESNAPGNTSLPPETGSVNSKETDSLLDEAEVEVSFRSTRINRIYRPHEPEKQNNSKPRSPAPVCDSDNI